jgi:diguanylate cyclase (GGDEF)-like protein
MADIDELKSINDSSGNSAGDQMLIDVAKLFSNVFRGEDVISRYGGDEFAVLLPGADEKISKVIIGRIQDQITAFNKTHVDQPMRISMGVSTAQQGESLKNHLKLASKQMAREKKSKN